jgi:predicted 3-demethylubiquinone-9 3-methyltransferase (glyoxalase superfamily)
MKTRANGYKRGRESVAEPVSPRRTSAPGDFPSGKKGDVLTVEFTVMGIPCLGLNGGPPFEHNEAFSFQVANADQAETDRYWDAIVGNGGEESECGWCTDKWGLSWQITPIALTNVVTGPDPAVSPAGSVNFRRHLMGEQFQCLVKFIDEILLFRPSIRSS